MKYLGLWSPGLRNIYWIICKTLRPPSYIRNVRSFSNAHWFSVKIKFSDRVQRNFFSLIVFGGNLLAGDVNSTVTMDRHAQAWQWIDSISLLPWGLLWASACSLEACSRGGVFLLLLSVIETVFWLYYLQPIFLHCVSKNSTPYIRLL